MRFRIIIICIKSNSGLDFVYGAVRFILDFVQIEVYGHYQGVLIVLYEDVLIVQSFPRNHNV